MTISTLLVAGAINHDIIATSVDEPVLGTSNSCAMAYSFGGVGFNIARHLSNYGHIVKMLSALGDDSIAQQALDHAHRFGIDTSLVDIIHTHKTASYFAINQPSGQLFAAMADMEVIKNITESRFKKRLFLENNVSALIIDANLSGSMVGFLHHYAISKKIPFTIGVGVSVAKIHNFQGLWSAFDIMVLNELEADELMTDLKPRNAPLLKAQRIHHLGVRHAIITLGSKGAVYAGQDGSFFMPVSLVDHIVDTHGAGDAFAAGLIDGFLKKKPLLQAMEQGFILAQEMLLKTGAEPKRKYYDIDRSII